MIAKGKYMILEHPGLGLPDLHKVKVVRVYDHKGGPIVRYRYNWPFPITKDVTEAKFESWIATPPNKPEDTKTVDLIADLTISLKEKQGTERKETHAMIDKTISKLLIEARLESLEEVMEVGLEFDKGFKDTVAHNCLLNRIHKLKEDKL